MNVIRFVQTGQIVIYEGLAFRVVVQREYPPLRWPDILFGCAEIHRRHGEASDSIIESACFFVYATVVVIFGPFRGVVL